LGSGRSLLFLVGCPLVVLFAPFVGLLLLCFLFFVILSLLGWGCPFLFFLGGVLWFLLLLSFWLVVLAPFLLVFLGLLLLLLCGLWALRLFWWVALLGLTRLSWLVPLRALVVFRLLAPVVLARGRALPFLRCPLLPPPVARFLGSRVVGCPFLCVVVSRLVLLRWLVCRACLVVLFSLLRLSVRVVVVPSCLLLLRPPWAFLLWCFLRGVWALAACRCLACPRLVAFGRRPLLSARRRLGAVVSCGSLRPVFFLSFLAPSGAVFPHNKYTRNKEEDCYSPPPNPPEGGKKNKQLSERLS